MPNLLKERTISPTFRNGLKLKKKLNINVDILQHIKMKLNQKRQKQNNNANINYKKLLNGNKNNSKTAYNGFKNRNDNVNLLNRFVYNNKKIKNRELSERRNKNASANRSNRSNFAEKEKNVFGTNQNRKIKHNYSALNI